MNGWSPDKTWREECGIFAAFVPVCARVAGPDPAVAPAARSPPSHGSGISPAATRASCQ